MEPWDTMLHDATARLFDQTEWCEVAFPSTELATSYTLWSHDRLLGHSDLAYNDHVAANMRMGEFVATEIGEQVMPAITGLRSARHDLGKTCQQIRSDHGKHVGPSEFCELLRNTTAYADSKAAESHCEALELQLRGPDGSIIDTESISIQDTELLLSLARESETFDYVDDPSLVGEIDPQLQAEMDAEAADIEQYFEQYFEELEDIAGDFAAATQESWAEATFPRYQIFVHLVNEWSIP